METNLNKEEIASQFISYATAKNKQALYVKLTFISVIIICIIVLYFCYGIVKNATNKIIVVDAAGQMLPVKSENQEQLYKALLTTHCYSVSYYINTFDVNNIKNNQVRASFLVNKADLNSIIGKYQHDKAYSDAMTKGTVYRCTFDKIESVQVIGNGSEYQVEFTSNLEIIDNTSISKSVKIVSKGTAIRTTPRFPENPTGFYFKSYIQEYYN